MVFLIHAHAKTIPPPFGQLRRVEGGWWAGWSGWVGWLAGGLAGLAGWLVVLLGSGWWVRLLYTPYAVDHLHCSDAGALLLI